MEVKSVVALIVVLYLQNCESCGERKIVYPLIKNGFKTEPGSFPWHVAIYHQEKLEISYRCGGTLINEDTVLTTANCVYNHLQKKPLVPDRIIVHLGKHNILTMSAHTKEFRAKSIEIHENFTSAIYERDIAKVKLDGVVRFTPYIQPICLWDQDRRSLSEVENKVGTMVGWGFTENDTTSESLQAATIPVVSHLTCLGSNRPVFGEFLSNTMFCGGHRNGTVPCRGDSGGGLYFEEAGIWKLRGILSFGVNDKGTCSQSDYVVFTDIAPFLEWINGPGFVYREI